MRLLHTTTLQMGEFFASSAIPNFETKQLIGSESQKRNVPKYAILSHVWGPDEVSFQDMVGDQALAMNKTGWVKIQDSCKQARIDGLEYIWIDTCCIDKTSSTELSEAINSMFQWYKGSAICYIYLPDVNMDITVFFNNDDYSKSVLYDYKDDNTKFDQRKEFRSKYSKEGRLKTFYITVHSYSRWFSRGWTLQELLAPSKVQFFDKYWKSIGTKEDHLQQLSGITKIDLFALKGGDFRRMSIARRMSWAANRQTTRAEDMAYCLLGIFDINMPLLYGEGAKAFVRLQEEILKVSNDQSLFAWKDPTVDQYRDDYPEASHPQGLLAASPDMFQYSNNVAQFYTETPGRAFSSFTNKGLQVEFLMCQDLSYVSGLVYLAVLSCQVGKIPGILPAIRLRRIALNSEQYARVDISQLLQICSLDSRNRLKFQGFDPTKPQDRLSELGLKTVYLDWTARTVFIRHEPQFPLLPGFWLVPSNPFGYQSIKVLKAHPVHLWDENTRVMQPQHDLSQGTQKMGALLVSFRSIKCILIFGTTYWELNPWCQVIPYLELNHNEADLGTHASSTLEKVFESFRVDQIQLPTNMDTRRHEYISDTNNLRTITELKTISGRDMYLIHLLPTSDDPSDGLDGFRVIEY